MKRPKPYDRTIGEVEEWMDHAEQRIQQLEGIVPQLMHGADFDGEGYILDIDNYVVPSEEEHKLIQEIVNEDR